MAKNKNGKDRETTEGQDNLSISLETTGERRQHITPRTQSPFSFMRRFSEEMDRLFGDFGFGSTLNFDTGLDRFASWSPQVEVFERNKQLGNSDGSSRPDER
jgi:hypothetical protein